jgi:hypothetical protein
MTIIASPVASTVERFFPAAREKVFLHVVPIDLTTIFTGFGPLPAVTGTRDETGPWDAAGRQRTVCLSDGSFARERLTAYEKPRGFAYVVSGFTGSLRFLAQEARGEWWFEEAAGGTTVRWRYVFVPRSVFARPLLWAINRFFWRRYMHAALRLAAASL